ncbi:hypothetical protein ACS0TY_026368 [Phlomoides rotata]
MVLTLIPSFRDLLHQAQLFNSFCRSIDGPPSVPTAFMASDRGGSSSSHSGSSQSGQGDRSLRGSSFHGGNNRPTNRPSHSGPTGKSGNRGPNNSGNNS